MKELAQVFGLGGIVVCAVGIVFKVLSSRINELKGSIVVKNGYIATIENMNEKIDRLTATIETFIRSQTELNMKYADIIARLEQRLCNLEKEVYRQRADYIQGEI